MQLNNNT